MKITLILHDPRRELAHIRRQLETLIERTRTMATQDDIDQLTARIQGQAARVQTALDGIRQDLADLKAAHPELDLSSLDASVAQLEQVGASAEELDGENPAPPAV